MQLAKLHLVKIKRAERRKWGFKSLCCETGKEPADEVWAFHLTFPLSCNSVYKGVNYMLL